MKRTQLKHYTLASFVEILLGLWLMSSPYALHFEDQAIATSHSVVMGIVFVILGVPGAFEFYQKPWVEWLSAVFAVWLLMAPWALGFSAWMGPRWTHLLTGILLLGVTTWGASKGQSRLGGSRSKMV